MESAYWPGNEKERVATELKRHGGMRYMMSGPWNETSCEYYEEIQQLALLTASREIARGIATNSVVATAVHARYHQKTMGCAHIGHGKAKDPRDGLRLPTRERKHAPPSKP